MRAPLLIPMFILAGCASKELIAKSSEYGSAHETVRTQYGEFMVYEHPTGKRLAVSSTLAGAVGQGIAKGLSFGAGSIRPSEGAFQEAAEQYLAKHKALAACKITNGYLLQDPIFEFTIDC